jgi:hypothetical protein
MLVTGGLPVRGGDGMPQRIGTVRARCRRSCALTNLMEQF